MLRKYVLASFVAMAAALNGYEDRVTVLRMAVSDTRGTVAINIPASVGRGSGVSEGGTAFISPVETKGLKTGGDGGYWRNAIDKNTEEIPAMPISEIVEKGASVDFLKVDVEG